LLFFFFNSLASKKYWKEKKEYFKEGIAAMREYSEARLKTNWDERINKWTKMNLYERKKNRSKMTYRQTSGLNSTEMLYTLNLLLWYFW